MNYTFKVNNLSHARYPSFFFVKLESVTKNIIETVIPTIQVNQSKVLVSGKKPDKVSEFEHAKLCIVLAGRFNPDINFEERKKIYSSNDGVVKIRELAVLNHGVFEVVINNRNETIYLNNLEGN